MVIINFLLNKTIIAYLIVILTTCLCVSIFHNIRKKVNIPIILCTILTFFAVVISFIIFVIATNIIANTIQWPSRVDASSIALLNNEQVDNIEYSLHWMANNGMGVIRNYIEFTDTHPQKHAYTFSWIPDPQQGYFRLRIFVNVFRSKEKAYINIQPRPGPMGGRRNNHNIFLTNENNTDVLLVNPSMSVSASGLYLPNNNRWIRSEIRFNNVILDILEIRPWYDLRNNDTSKFILNLVEISQYLSE